MGFVAGDDDIHSKVKRFIYIYIYVSVEHGSLLGFFRVLFFDNLRVQLQEGSWIVRDSK